MTKGTDMRRRQRLYERPTHYSRFNNKDFLKFETFKSSDRQLGTKAVFRGASKAANKA